MTTNKFNELKNASKKGKVFLVMENGEHIVCDKLDDLRYCNTTLKIHLDGMYTYYTTEIQALKDKIDKQDKIIQELVSAIKTLNKKGV